MKHKKTQDFTKFLEVDKKTKEYIEKIDTISLIHNTGHINLITSKGNEIKARMDDLVTELKIDQDPKIINNNATIFNDIIIFKYTEKRSKEYDKIVQRSKLYSVLNTIKNGFGIYEVRIMIHMSQQQKPITI